MDQCTQLIGEFAVSCGDFSVRAEVCETAFDVEQPSMARVDLLASGPNDDGSVSLRANGNVSARVDAASIDVTSDGVVVDGGAGGKVGMRVGTAPMIQSITASGNGGNIVLENGQLPVSPTIQISPDSIELSVGPNKITIGPTGIEISGIQVNVKGNATATLAAPAVTVQGDVQVAVKGAMASLEGSGMTTVKGGVVMIN